MIIAKSDAVILVVSASLLAAGVYRWQSNVSQTHERRAVASSPSVIQSDTNLQSNAGSLAAKPDTTTASVTRTAGDVIDAPAETKSLNAVQSSTQKAADTSGDRARQPNTSNTTGQPLYGTYEVESGDTLSRIAINFGTTVVTLRSINDISGSLITIGQNIRYPLPAN